MKVCCCDAVGIELYVDSNLLWNEKTCTFLIPNLLNEGDKQLFVVLFSLASYIKWCFHSPDFVWVLRTTVALYPLHMCYIYARELKN